MKSKPPKQTAPTQRLESAASPGGGTRWWWHAAILLGLFLANAALYHRCLALGFLSVDDPDYIQNNPLIESFRAANLKRIFTQPFFANYAPLNLLSYAMDVALAGGKSAFALHLSNVLWSGWVVCMVYMLAFAIRAEIFTAVAAAFLFLLHPAHVEVVAWVSCRKDLIATGFAVLSMTCYLFSRRQTRRRPWWYAGSVLCFLLASAAKQSVLLLPAVMLVWDALVERRRGWAMLADKIPFGLITSFFGWMTWQAQPSTNHAWQAFVVAATQFVNLWLLTGFGQYVLYRTAPDPDAWSDAARGIIVLAALLVWIWPLLFRKVRRALFQSRSRPDLRIPQQFSSRPSPPSRGSWGAMHSGLVGRTASFGLVAAALYYWMLIHMVPPMLLNFMVPITDRYLFLPSVAVCILLAGTAGTLFGLGAPNSVSAKSEPRDSRRRKGVRSPWVGTAVLTGLALIWGAQASSYLNEWGDPRSVWYGAHSKTKSSQVSQFLGEVYQNAGDRVDDFIKSGTPLQVTNEVFLAQAVLGDAVRVEQLRAEWSGAAPVKTNSLSYRDQLWGLTWEQFELSAARRGTLSAPNLFMNRGRLLVREGKADKAIPEFQQALGFAQTSTYDLVRREMATHALYAIGVAYWNLRKYKDAEQWLLKAQEHQRNSGQVWIPALDREVERIKGLATSSPDNKP